MSTEPTPDDEASDHPEPPIEDAFFPGLFLSLSYAADDVQYGFSKIVNNIPGLWGRESHIPEPPEESP
jgi:hypothetical protein